MSARVGRGLIGVRSPRGIEWYRPPSVRMPVAPSSQQFERTCPGNLRTKVCIAIRLVVGQHQDRARWNPPVKGNRLVQVSNRPHGYRCQQDEKGRYFSWQMSARVAKGPIGVRSPRGIAWYRPRTVRMPLAPSSQQFESTCPGNSSTKVWIIFQQAVRQHRDRVRWNPLAEGNRMV